MEEKEHSLALNLLCYCEAAWGSQLLALKRWWAVWILGLIAEVKEWLPFPWCLQVQVRPKYI